ncbi:MAG: cation:proton antiporter [Candidatus Omnitrophota bacterium]|nr:MAG: cation:proton antiporter [Candidatus Omnitrophota bacterium]
MIGMNNTIFSLGLILLFGFIGAKIIRGIRIPAITAYLLVGIIIGPYMLNLVSKGILGSSGLISNIVLGFIAFSIGQNFLISTFRKIGRPVLWISILEAGGAWILVTLAFLFILKQPFHIAFLFGAISSATAPAATTMVIREYKAKGSFTDTLLGIVAIDDAWCLIIFAISLAISKSVVASTAASFLLPKVVFHSLLEIFGAFILGGVFAVALSYFSRYTRTSEDLLIYTIGFILLNIGLSIYLHLSVLLSCMSMGAALVNINRVSFKFFDTLRSIDSPLYLLFFVLAGANLDIGLLKTLGLSGLFYLIFRSFGKIGGAYLGGRISTSSYRIRRYIGLGLFPQAGVALGVALIAKANFPQIGEMIFSTIVATTIIYELIGPSFTKFALRKAGEIL